MIIAGAALAALLSTCAPDVVPSTMAAIIAVESGGNSFALNDNTMQRSYAPGGYAQALATAQPLVRHGHSVDVGIAQVNSANFAAFHTTEREMLDPCQNLAVASRILADAYTRSSVIFADPRFALWHAISVYNSGSLYAGKRHVDRVVAAASRVPLVPPIELLRHGAVSNSSSTVADPVSKRQHSMRAVQLADFSFGKPNVQKLVVRISEPSLSTNVRAR